MSVKRWRSRIGRHLRRWLGLPVLSLRTTLLIFLLFMGLAYLSVTVLTDFFATLDRYAPRYYEPKDFARE